MLAGWGIGFVTILIMLGLANLIEKVVVRVRHNQMEKRRKIRHRRLKTPSCQLGQANTSIEMGTGSIPVCGIPSASVAVSRSTTLPNEELVLLVSGNLARAQFLATLAGAEDRAAQARTVVAKGCKANGVRLSKEACEEVEQGLLRLAHAIKKVEDTKRNHEHARDNWRTAYSKVHQISSVVSTVKCRITTKLDTRMMEREVEDWTDTNSFVADGAFQDKYMTLDPSTTEKRFREVRSQKKAEGEDDDAEEGSSRLLSEKMLEYVAMGLIFLCSQLMGLGYAMYLLFRFPAMYQFMGAWVLVSRGEAMAVVFLTVFLFLLLSRGFITQLRRLVGHFAVFEAMVDHHVSMHVATFAFMVFCSILHVIGHLCGSIPFIIHAKNEDEVNKALTYGKKMDRKLDSWGDAFKSYVGVTGILLLLTLAVFSALSNERVRRWWFELFHYPHLILINVWVGLLIAHGCMQWLGIGVPLAAISAAPALLYYGVERSRHIWAAGHKDIHIHRAEVRSKTVILEIDTGNSGYTYKTGMYCMVNVPEISLLQWHPFTIAAGAGHPRLTIFFAVCGDWTTHFKLLLQSAHDKAKAASDHEGETCEPIYPTIRLRGGYGAPAQSVRKRRHAIMVGAGIGATPFLSFLAQVCDPEHQDAGDHEGLRCLRYCRFYWVSREPQDYSMINEYARVIDHTPHLKQSVDIRLCLSKSIDTKAGGECSAVESAAFWLGAQVALRDASTSVKLQTEMGAPTSFGRPDWKAELKSVADTVRKRRQEAGVDDTHDDEAEFEVSVYVCGNQLLCQALEEACIAASCTDLSFRLFAEQF